MRISVDGRRIRNNKVAFSNLSGKVYSGPKQKLHTRFFMEYSTIFQIQWED